VGDYSRSGQARGPEPVKALDHDMSPKAALVPFGILEISRGRVPINQPWVIFGHSKQTSDFIGDAVESWWDERKTVHPHVTKIHIELDNGPEISSSRTQFMKRLVEFADRQQLKLELVYLPPYHSKYNPIERFWGVLEKHWNGALLGSIATVLLWAATMTWRQIRPIVRESHKTYQRGVRLTQKAFRPISIRLKRSQTLPKWSLIIEPIRG
jgi:transposase